MKVKKEKLTNKERMRTLDALYTAASSLRGRESVKSFLKDLLTGSERIMLGRRILIARLLLEKTSYSEIVRRLGVGKDTVWKVQRWLEDQFPGYELAIEGIEAEEDRRRKILDRKGTSVLAKLKRKYPLHFLLFPWPKGTGPKRNLDL